jgi:putative ABC transport system permease protein
VAALVLVGGFIEDVFVQLREATIHSQLGHLQVSREGYTTVGRRDPFAYLIEQPDQQAVPLAALPGVGEVMARLSLSGLASNGQADRPVLIEGVEPDKEARLGTFVSLLAGRQLHDADTFGILLGKGIARTLRLNPGDTVTLLANTPEGALNSLEFEVVGVFGSFSREYDDRAVRIPLAAAQELVATPGAHTLVFSLTRTEDTDGVVARVREALAGQGFEVQPWHELADFYNKSVDLYRRQFAVLQLIILAMVLLGVANSINLSLYERTGEFGTMRALGRRSGGIFSLVILESALLGVLGAVVGVAVGALVGWVASTVGIPMPPLPNSDVGYTARIPIVADVVLTAALVGLLAPGLASILPARRAAQMPVVEALRASV